MNLVTTISVLIATLVFFSFCLKGCALTHEERMETLRYNRYICETKGVCVNTSRYGGLYQ